MLDDVHGTRIVKLRDILRVAMVVVVVVVVVVDWKNSPVHTFGSK